MKDKQYGLSLVELMIAITLGLILLTGVMQVFLSSKTVFSTQQALSRIQETGRLGIEFISRDIRMAGYMGCASRSAYMTVTNTLNSPNNFQYDFGTAIKGYTQGSSTNAIPVGTLTPAALDKTDMVVVRSATGGGVTVTQNNNGAQVFLKHTGTEAGACGTNSDRISGICPDDIVVMTDCTKARVFQVTSLNVASNEVNVTHAGTGTPGNAITSWGGNSAPEEEVFKPGAELLLASNITYYIATGTSGRPSLWQKVNNTELELLEGVEDMSITYGVDTTAQMDFVPDGDYKTAEKVANDWARVVSVRVELLVASIEDNVVPDVQKYRFKGVDDVSPNPADRRLRQVFSTTIGIRSRSF